MRRIPLKTMPGEFNLDYRQVLTEVIRRPLNPQQGISLDEMRRGVRVLDAIEAANGEVELEDADYDHLVEKLRVMPWNMVDRRILQLVDDVEHAVAG